VIECTNNRYQFLVSVHCAQTVLIELILVTKSTTSISALFYTLTVYVNVDRHNTQSAACPQ